ncbi:MAG: lysophospholipid acyltransferase family protein [Longimicrobiales bacterium]
MSGVRDAALGAVGAGLLGPLFATLRESRVEEEHYLRLRAEGTPIIFVFWHAHTLPLAWCHRDEGIVTLVSEHGDGEALVRLIRRWGFGSVRGSSTRGATKALKGLIRAARAGKDLAITPDGPRGPEREFKPGALAVAQATGLPVVPLAAGASGAWRVRSWDRSLIPHPFSRLCVAYGPPRRVPAHMDRDRLGALARELGEELDALADRASACATS